jgi:hypothetical protein
MMQALGNELLARAALSDHQDRTIEGRRAARALDRVEKRQTLPNELFGPLHAPPVGGKSHHLARIFTPCSSRKMKNFGSSAHSAILAQLLYSLSQ